MKWPAAPWRCRAPRTAAALLAIAAFAAAADTAVLTSAPEVLASLRARIVCSSRFNSGLPLARTLAEDLAGYGGEGTVVDELRKRAVHQSGSATVTAVFVAGTGCTPLVGVEEKRLRAEHEDLARKVKALPYASAPLQAGADVPGVDRRQLAAALDAAFREESEDQKKATRAIIVLHRNRVIAERYAAGIGPDTPLAGFSMSKSVLNAVVGVLVKKQLIAGVQQPVALREWSEPGDPRAQITYDHLLRMTSGLVWKEDYSDPTSDVLVSLFGAVDSARLAISRGLYTGPEQHYNYSSGSTQILAAAIRRLLQATQTVDPDLFVYRELFAPLGMRSAFVEMDPAGQPIYAASAFASARDWMRLGRFFLEDGRAGGVRLLPDGWVAYSTTPSAASENQQGALFAVNRAASPRWPKLPADTYALLGFRGQRLLLIPSLSLAILRLGASTPETAWNEEEFAAAVIGAIAPSPAAALSRGAARETQKLAPTDR